uniref:Uncharacterized protein n=1 Tax=Panagrolaimus sp. ES5 TaxID=591445 RepID=A0AC34G0Z2_9BILA
MNDATQQLVNCIIVMVDGFFILALVVMLFSVWLYGFRVVSFMLDEKSRERDRKVAEKLKKAQGPKSIVVEQERTQRILKQLEEDAAKNS